MFGVSEGENYWNNFNQSCRELERNKSKIDVASKPCMHIPLRCHHLKQWWGQQPPFYLVDGLLVFSIFFFCGGLVGKVVGGFLEVEVDHHNKWKRRCMFSVLRVCGRFVCLLRPDHEETWEKQVKQLIQFRQPTVKVNWCFTSTAAVAEKKMRRRCGCGGWGLRNDASFMF